MNIVPIMLLHRFQVAALIFCLRATARQGTSSDLENNEHDFRSQLKHIIDQSNDKPIVRENQFLNTALLNRVLKNKDFSLHEPKGVDDLKIGDYVKNNSLDYIVLETQKHAKTGIQSSNTANKGFKLPIKYQYQNKLNSLKNIQKYSRSEAKINSDKSLRGQYDLNSRFGINKLEQRYLRPTVKKEQPLFLQKLNFREDDDQESSSTKNKNKIRKRAINDKIPRLIVDLGIHFVSEEKEGNSKEHEKRTRLPNQPKIPSTKRPARRPAQRPTIRTSRRTKRPRTRSTKQTRRPY